MQQGNDIARLADALEKLANKATRPLLDVGARIDDSNEVTIDKQGYAHVFLLSPTALTIVPGGIPGDNSLQLSALANQWLNVTFDDGVALKTSGQATVVNIILRYTNEVIP